MEILAFNDIAPQPIKIQIRSASQNDYLDFRFLKDIYCNCRKWLERGVNRWFMSRKFDAPPSIFGLCNVKNAWDKIILGLKNSRGIGQVSVQFSKWHAILSRSNSWQCNWLECALLHKGPLLPSVPFENSKKKRKETHKMWYWYLCQKLFLP